MINTTDLTSGILSEELHAGPDTAIMTLVLLGVLSGVMILLLLGTFYARHKEHRENAVAGVTVIPQQSVHRCPHHYLLMFYTGFGRHSGTTANVFCRIYGNHHKTKPIILRDPDRPMFQPSSRSSFLVTLSRSLDQIKEIQVWHDISGPDPPWYLESVTICHLNTDITWYFEANRWLDVSAGSKEVDCKLKPSERKTYLGDKTLFDAKFNDNLKSKHLWFSNLFPNNRKTFGKFQKMSCCLAVVGIIALSATFVVETTYTAFPNTSVRLGPWRLKLGDIYRALVCSGIAFVVRILLETLFLNSKTNRTLGTCELNVEEHIQDYSQRLNAIVFLDENTAVDKDASSLSSQNENESDDEWASDLEELQIELQSVNPLKGNGLNEVSDHTINNSSECLIDITSMEGGEKNHSSNKAHNLEDLIDVLGDLPEKEQLINILDKGSNDVVGEGFCLEDLGISFNSDILSLDDDSLKLEFESPEEELSNSVDAYGEEETIYHPPESFVWTSNVTNPDKIPELWKQLPFPHHLIDEDSIKKPKRRIPTLPHIVLKITQAQCFILPFLCTVVTIAIGFQWPAAMATSWIVTFAIAIACEMFLLETLYMFIHAMYFAKWCKRPVKEEDLINELSNKVWVSDDQDVTYYADEVVDEEEGELVPRPPSQEDIQKARETAGRDRELEDVLKMLVFNVLFLVLLILISFGNRDASSYPTRVGMQDSFNISKSFLRVKNTETFWKWLMNDTISVLFFDPLDKTPNEGRRHFLTDGYTYLLGAAILRQQRIKPEMSCQFPDVVKDLFSECHPVFLTESNEDKSDYNQGWKKEATPNHKSPWKHLSGEESQTDYNAWGRKNVFQGGGYIAYLSGERQSSLKLVHSLKTHGWVDQLTRVVFLEFSIYNANVNILSALIFSIEFTCYGGALPRFDMYSFRLYRYYTSAQVMYLVCEVIFVAFVVQLISRVGHQIYRDRLSYFMSFWNYTDLSLIFFSLVIISLYAVRWIHLNKAIEAIRENPNTFYDFFTVALYDEFIAYISCLIFLIPCLQFMKFLKFNKNFMIFYSTLERIRSDICGFAFVFLVSMLCFTYWAYTMLNTQAETFSTFIGTFYTMIAMLLGKFSFRLLSPGQVITSEVGPIFIYAFTVSNVFFILNIILTIITIGFAEAQADERFQQSEYEIVKFIINSIKDRLGLLPPYIPPPPQITPPAKEKHYTYFQWKLCTSYVTQSQFPRLLKFANKTYLEDFVDELEMVADLLSLPMPREVLEELIRREKSSESLA